MWGVGCGKSLYQSLVPNFFHRDFCEKLRTICIFYAVLQTKHLGKLNPYFRNPRFVRDLGELFILHHGNICSRVISLR